MVMEERGRARRTHTSLRPCGRMAGTGICTEVACVMRRFSSVAHRFIMVSTAATFFVRRQFLLSGACHPVMNGAAASNISCACATVIFPWLMGGAGLYLRTTHTRTHNDSA